MEAIQTLLAKMDQISQKVENVHLNQVASYRVSCGFCGLIGHHSLECQQVSGNLYPYYSDGKSNAISYMPENAYPQQVIENQYYSYDSSPPITNYSLYAPVQEMQVVPNNSRIEELMEQLLLSQQKREAEMEQRFQHYLDKLDQINNNTNLLESKIAQFYAGASQVDNEDLPKHLEACPKEGENESILQKEGQLETSEPEVQMETEHQHEALTSELNSAINFSINTNACFMVDAFDRFMELKQEECCRKGLLQRFVPNGNAKQKDGGPWRKELQLMKNLIRPPLHDLKIMKWWDTG